MSAPKTNIEKQKKRHFTPLVGISIAVAFGALMFLLYIFGVFDSAEAPTDSESELQEASPPASEDAGAVETDTEQSAAPEGEGSGTGAGTTETDD